MNYLDVLTAQQISALLLLSSPRNKLTNLGNIIVSCNVKSLLSHNLIKYNNKVWCGYSLTTKGKEVIDSLSKISN